MVNIYCEGSGLDVSYAKKFFDPAVQLTTNKIIGNKGAEYMQIGKEEIEQYFNGEKSLEDTLDSIESRVNEALGKKRESVAKCLYALACSHVVRIAAWQRFYLKYLKRGS